MVTINLLPQKSKRLTNKLLWTLLIGVVWLAGAAFLGWTYYAANENIASMQQQIKQQEKLLDMMEQQQQAAKSTNTIEQYIQLSERVQHLFYPTTIMLDQLASNLPAMGRLESVSYQLDGSISVIGSFEQYEDVAAYLHNLELSPYVIKAEMKSIASVPVKWTGPVDEEGKPLSVALQAVGGNILPRYKATIDIVVLTFDGKQIQKIISSPELAKAIQKKNSSEANSDKK